MKLTSRFGSSYPQKFLFNPSLKLFSFLLSLMKNAYLFSSDHCLENHAASLKVSCAVGLILNQSFCSRNSIACRLEVRWPAWMNSCYKLARAVNQGALLIHAHHKRTLYKRVARG
ncbi:hypothetical protein C0J52_05413 [Blattella germanica]|nr:hypothetical protein C0J52_05413 [Blattella germanica]